MDNSTPSPLLVINGDQHDDDSLHSEADSEENTESEMNLKWWNGQDSESDPHLENAVQEQKSQDLIMSDDEEDEDDQLSQIFYMLIPSEITSLIFKRLDLSSKRASRLVCRRWLQLVDPLVAWYPELCDESVQSVLNFTEKGYTANTLVVTKLMDFCYPLKGIGLMAQSLEFHSQNVPIHMTMMMEEDPTLRKTLGISNSNLNMLLFEYRNIEGGLILNSGALMSSELPSLFNTTNFTNLTSLEIFGCNEDGRGYCMCLETMGNMFPKLKRLKLTIEYHRETILLHHPPYYKQVFQFVGRHCKTLTSFELVYSNLTDENIMPPFIFDLDHSIPVHVFQDTMSKLKNVQLSEFTFKPTFYEARSRFLYGVQLMNHQERLTCLKLENLSRSNFGVWEAGVQLMQKCSKTLNSIHCDGPLDEFSCRVLQFAKNLKDIRITICGVKIVDVELLPVATVKILHLGHGLSANQIKFIATNMTQLVEWYLPQDRAQFDRTIPKTSIGIFKSAVKLPKLQKLVLTKRCSSWKRIRKIISYTQGLDVGDRDPSDPKDACYVKIMIERRRLELDRL
ncbi:F-box only protein 48 [Folsomia candida]|uniref:F-box only protein 48 n=1 Tax=Folsomia candida TaxID=158441 RepID=A0A226EEG6_FOLCA|nr:F-box only protein 48 [Folsomia candida]